MRTKLKTIAAVGLLIILITNCTSKEKKTRITRNTANESSISSTPPVYLEPSPLFDTECEQRTKFKIDISWQKELYERLTQFQEAWAKTASKIMSASENAANRKFPRKDYDVALTLCAWTPMQHPFIVSARPYLDAAAKSDKKTKAPLNLNHFVSMTHHEVLHSLGENIVNEYFSNTSAMLEKYKAEPFNVLVHLHLMAVQKSAFEQTKNEVLRTSATELYNYIGGDYKRAWEIIQKEGTALFIQELQTYNQKKK